MQKSSEFFLSSNQVSILISHFEPSFIPCHHLFIVKPIIRVWVICAGTEELEPYQMPDLIHRIIAPTFKSVPCFCSQLFTQASQCLCQVSPTSQPRISGHTEHLIQVQKLHLCCTKRKRWQAASNFKQEGSINVTCFSTYWAETSLIKGGTRYLNPCRLNGLSILCREDQRVWTRLWLFLNYST